MPLQQTGLQRISLCMIVKNEAATLASCLESARPWVGEMVVVDTGSTDETVAIALAAGARVEHFAWCDDFAAARNVALEAATREWALVLDADETLHVTDPDEWTRAVQQTSIDGFSFRIRNMLDDGQESVATVFRLFKRTKAGMRYRGEIHEQVGAVSDHQAHTAALGCAYFEHTGYTAEVVQSKAKVQRNIGLARKLVASRPTDPYAWYALGLSVRSLDLGQMIDAYEKSRELWDQEGRDGSGETFLAGLYVGLAEALISLNRLPRAHDVLNRGLVLFAGSPDLHAMRGQLRLQAEDFAGAVADFEACLTDDAKNFFLIYNPDTTGAPARTSLAVALQQLGRHVEAEARLGEAIAEARPGFGRAHRLLGNQLLQRGEWAQALTLLEYAFSLEPAESRLGLGWCLYKLERYDEAIEVLLPLDEVPEVQHLLGKSHLEAGRGAQALPYLEACSLPSAGLARGWAYYVTEQAAKAASCWEVWLRAGAADWGTKDTLATFCFLLDGGKPPTGQPERPAEPLRDMDQWFRLLLRHRCFKAVEAAMGRGPQLNERIWWPLRRRWGITLLKEDFFDVGLDLLLAARADEPQEAEIYYWLGYASLHQRQFQEARIMWEACLHYNPGHVVASQALGLLTSSGRAS